MIMNLALLFEQSEFRAL